ncbi:MAG: MFS transporter [Alphaproteobacteria bacterium]
MTAGNAAPEDMRPLDRVTEAACYASGFFSLGLVPTMWIVIPLWALELGASPLEIGFIVGARAVLPLMFSIHGGVVMDRLGIRRVMFWLAGACFLQIPLYPLMPWIPALIFLQLIFGLTQSLTWIGAQAQIGELTAGSPVHSGRFGFASGAGTFAGPLVAGVAWDTLGHYGAFAVIGLWCAALWASIRFLPAAPAGAANPPVPFDLGILMPRLKDYVEAAKFAAVPAVAVVVIAAFGRIGAVSVQGSFYPVYLASIDYTGTIIGGLIATSSLFVALSALLNDTLARFVSQYWILVGAIGLSVVAICATPFFTSLTVLAGLAVLYGFGVGLTLPSALTILSRAAGPARQGLAPGVRGTANRLASLVVPVSMGVVVGLFDMQTAFVVVGAAMAATLVAMGVMIVRYKL